MPNTHVLVVLALLKLLKGDIYQKKQKEGLPQLKEAFFLLNMSA